MKIAPTADTRAHVELCQLLLEISDFLCLTLMEWCCDAQGSIIMFLSLQGVSGRVKESALATAWIHLDKPL